MQEGRQAGEKGVLKRPSQISTQEQDLQGAVLVLANTLNPSTIRSWRLRRTSSIRFTNTTVLLLCFPFFQRKETGTLFSLFFLSNRSRKDMNRLTRAVCKHTSGRGPCRRGRARRGSQRSAPWTQPLRPCKGRSSREEAKERWGRETGEQVLGAGEKGSGFSVERIPHRSRGYL
jgi:hypothetical protein